MVDTGVCTPAHGKPCTWCRLRSMHLWKNLANNTMSQAAKLHNAPISPNQTVYGLPCTRPPMDTAGAAQTDFETGYPETVRTPVAVHVNVAVVAAHDCAIDTRNTSPYRKAKGHVACRACGHLKCCLKRATTRTANIYGQRPKPTPIAALLHIRQTSNWCTINQLICEERPDDACTQSRQKPSGVELHSTP